MKTLKLFLVIVLIVMLTRCGSTLVNSKIKNNERPVALVNDSLEYEITIVDVGFNSYLKTIARPRGFHSLKYLEMKNRFLVPIWNQRVANPSQFNPVVYENRIEYDFFTQYGYEVNYLLFQYFQFIQYKYRILLR